MDMGGSSTALSEQVVQDAFHSYLKSSLTQAKLERLLDAEVLSSAESDLMITGPALCLYFAALRCTTNPPSVPLPRSTKSSSSTSRPGQLPPMDLSIDNCPPAFKSFLRAWTYLVPRIQSLSPEHQHDLARIICGLPPLTLLPAQSSSSSNSGWDLKGIAAEMRSIALEIGQRRTFQDRYASALQAALDFDTGGRRERVTSFVPPPVYEPEVRPPSSLSTTSTASTPSILVPGIAPAIEFIRETLYAALADTLESYPSLIVLLRTDPARAYFGSVSLAILSVATYSLNLATEAVIGVLGTPLTLDECPNELKPLMRELLNIGEEAKELAEADDKTAVEAIGAGQDVPMETRMERARLVLIEGVGGTQTMGDGRRSAEGRVFSFANRIGRLAVKMMEVREFRERQDGVFRVLAGIEPK